MSARNSRAAKAARREDRDERKRRVYWVGGFRLLLTRAQYEGYQAQALDYVDGLIAIGIAPFVASMVTVDRAALLDAELDALEAALNVKLGARHGDGIDLTEREAAV